MTERKRRKSPHHITKTGFDFDSGPTYDPYKTLWQCVIKRALHDLINSVWGERSEKYKAREWFETSGRDFRDVCDYAVVHPDDMRALARKIIKTGRWRW